MRGRAASTVLGGLLSLSCASGTGEETAANQGGGGSTAQGGNSGAGGSIGIGGFAGSPSCGNPLDLAECPCSPGALPRACYSGPAETLGIGVCAAGKQVCSPSSTPEVSVHAWGECSGSSLPSTETCDGVDNDCDGLADEGCNDGGLCVPTTCVAQAKNCGSIPDGCGASLACGTCTAPATCGAGGKPGVCGTASCTPTTCSAQGKSCGTIADSCGGLLQCGSCPSGQSCSSSNVCAQNPVSCPAVVASGQGDIIALAVGGGALHWVDQKAPISVKSVPLAGGQVKTLAAGLPGNSAVDCSSWWTSIAADAKRVYWALGIQSPNNDPLALASIATTGGLAAPVTPSTFSASSVVTNGADVGWTTGLGAIHVSVVGSGIDKEIKPYSPPYYASLAALDSSTAYVITHNKDDLSSHKLEKLAISGGGSTVVAAMEVPSPNAFQINGGFAYWIDHPNVVNPPYRIRRVPLTGGAVQVLATVSYPSWSLAVDGLHVYFSERGQTYPTVKPALVQRVPVAGGSVATLAQVYPYPHDMVPVAVGPSCVYWVERKCDGTTVVGSAPK